jgi:tRNA (cmo5U34)-methyltransferase
MEATHEHGHEHEHAHEHEERRPREDWFDEDYVEYWIERQSERAAERRRQFALVRALLPKAPEDAFRYMNLGAGPGNLDEVLLEHYPKAEAVLVDGSMAMLAEARKRLERFEGRVEFVQANLATADWTGAVEGPFDAVVSSIAIHNLRDAKRIRELYGEINRLTGHGGVFLNLEYVRMSRPAFRSLAVKASQDAEANLMGGHGGAGAPGTVEEQLGWLREAGFAMAECAWREFGVALLVGVHVHLHLPEVAHDHGAHGTHDAGHDHDHDHAEAHHDHDHHDDHDHDHAHEPAHESHGHH